MQDWSSRFPDTGSGSSKKRPSLDRRTDTNGAINTADSAVPDVQYLSPHRSSSSPGPVGPLSVNFDTLELESYTEPQLIAQSLFDRTVQLTEAADAIDLFTRQSAQTLEKQRRLLTFARDALIEARMMPLGYIIERLPPILQQLETRHRKPVELTLHGTDVLVDKVVADKLYDPLLHLVRNAFDHGIEPIAVRQARHKPEKGHLEIRAHHQGKHLVIEVQDDGNGLDFEQIRQRAVERQVVSAQQAAYLTPNQLAELLFEPGFSTAAQLSELSGRGIGLDVVRNQLQAIQGEVNVISEPQQGTNFTLKIPLSLNIAKLLLCQADGKTYAFLPDAIEQILIPQPEQVQVRANGTILRLGEGANEQLVPLYSLEQALSYDSQRFNPPQSKASWPTSSGFHVLLFHYQGALLGLAVEHVLGEQELIIRPLGTLIRSPDYIYGASILADGGLALVLDGVPLVQRVFDQQSVKSTLWHPPSLGAQGEMSRDIAQPLNPPEPALKSKVRSRVLVVEDSITTRQTLVLTLQNAGYQVFQAKDGREAIAQLQECPNIQLVICDIEMPRMNGFEFLSYCQQDPTLADLPIVMLSSRSSQKHRQLAEQLGAAAYMSKPFLEHKLLAMMANLIESNPLTEGS
jgi:chemotaxis family two-component system sensor histidine kinase/response regulator PixL